MDLLSQLNEPQRQAVTHVDGPLLVLAGAGSGKTRVITHRVAYLIEQGIPPWQVLAITFTNKAAGEMATRVAELGTPHGATLCTFHSLCARLLREFAVDAGLSSNYSIYDRDDQLRVVKDAMGQVEISTDNLTPSQVHATISNAKNELKTPTTYADSSDDFYARRVAQVFAAYERMLADNNALDFDDLLLRMAFLMRDRADIRQLLGERYRYVLIDEYQDTNHAQYLLAHGIAMDHENLCATGDPDQSIYAWRGADISNILDFEKDYPNATVIRLEENYRSSGSILKAASALIANNRMRKEKALWTRRDDGTPVKVLRVDDEHAEAELITRRIHELTAGGVDRGDIAVFYRLNSLSRVMEESLLKSGTPYAVARGVEFYNRKEIKDLLAYLRVLINPDDDLSCARIINRPTRGIGQTSVDRLEQFVAANGIPLIDACHRGGDAGLSTAPTKQAAEFAEMIASLAGDLDRPVREIAEDVARTTGMEAAFRENGEEGRQALSNIDEFITAAAEFDDRSAEDQGLAEFLHNISLVSDVDHLSGAGGAVTLMTLHAAKGLEFPVVFVIGCEDGMLPFDRSQVSGGSDRGSSGAHREEERRLAFVGMTRAMDELTLSCARRRMIRGRRMPQAPSPFIAEIGEENVDIEDHTTNVYASQTRSSGGGFYDDVDQRSAIESAVGDGAPLPPEYEYLRVGSRVYHGKFGRGKVVRVGSQPWPDTRIEIIFDDSGPKKLVLARTSLDLEDG